MVRFAAALIAAVLVCQAPVVQAADLAAEPVQKAKRCNIFNNYFIWGDPTDCPNDEDVPACTSKTVVSAALRFSNRASPAYRVPRVKTFTAIGELPQSVYNPSPLVRRYCEGSVQLDNGDHARAYYFVEEDSGFVGISWNVYVCIDGYDRWRVYDGRCRVAIPAPPR
ncbi:hypothetical protein [Acuticoccus sp. I52.16.1]|uniref:hypothetical protein n=1 Tax=Acuticoccus sp. I52.16.1 TaxID=2928472 RepID=UPI001FD30EA1|nr:hypothetical protein [Acuticoccus sp. I52.16.1]UOM33469.1 hypothetical protein MRB58_16645 [Acuticoccus sp. I52.16.1]